MKKKLIVVLMISCAFAYSQKKKTPTKINSNPKSISVLPSTEKDNFLPVKFLQTAPSKTIDSKLLADLKTRKFDNVFSDQIPLDENNPDFQYDYLTNYRNKKTILISPDGREEEFSDKIDFINVFKDGSKIISDKCIEKTEVFHCQNLRIVSKEGIEKSIPSDYIYTINMGVNHLNLNNKSFVLIFNKNTSNRNIIDEKGTLVFDKDAYSINFLFPPYAIIEQENGVSKIYDLLDKKFVETQNLKLVKNLPAHKLLVMKNSTNNKFVLFDPKTKKTIFESDGSIMAIGEKEVAKDFFKILKDDNQQLINRNGDILFQDNASIFRIFENGDLLVDNNERKQNVYLTNKKMYMYPKFFNTRGEIGNFSYVKYDKFYEIANKNTGEIIYNESDRVQEYGKLGNLIYINKTFDTKPGVYLAGVYDIYNNENVLIAKDKNGFDRMSDYNDNYFTIRNINDYSIIDKNGKILIPSINIPNYVRYNNSKNTFELSKKRDGTPYECYNLTGNKVDCK